MPYDGTRVILMRPVGRPHPSDSAHGGAPEWRSRRPPAPRASPHRHDQGSHRCVIDHPDLIPMPPSSPVCAATSVFSVGIGGRIACVCPAERSSRPNRPPKTSMSPQPATVRRTMRRPSRHALHGHPSGRPHPISALAAHGPTHQSSCGVWAHEGGLRVVPASPRAIGVRPQRSGCGGTPHWGHRRRDHRR
jgi:hypothetical protein